MRRYAAAIDLGGTDIKAALVDEQGEIFTAQRTATGADRSPAKVIERLAAAVAALRPLAGPGEVVVVGIGSPGGVTPRTGVITQSPNFPGWIDVDLRGPLERAVGLPVFVDNDANVAALGEFAHAGGRGVDSMVLLTLGTGIGGGVILDGRIWRGEWGMAGEIGHVVVEPDGLPCGCGSWGCVESYASGPAMARYAQGELAKGRGARLRELAGGDPAAVTPKLIYDAALDGCELAREVFDRAGRYLGIVVAGVLNVLNVPLFLIGGGVGAAFDLLIDPLRTEVRRRAYRVPAENVRIEPANLGNDAGVIGAGLMAFAELSPGRRGG
jgi:glucokinase